MGAPPRKKVKQDPDPTDEESHASSYCTSDEDTIEDLREEQEEPMTQAAETENERREIADIMQRDTTFILLLDDRNTMCQGSPCLVDEEPDKYQCESLKQLLVYRLSLEWSDGPRRETSVYHIPCLEHLLDLVHHPGKLKIGTRSGPLHNALYAPLLHRWIDRKGRIDVARELEYIEVLIPWKAAKIGYEEDHANSRTQEHADEGCSPSCGYQVPAPKSPSYNADLYSCTLSTALLK